MREEGPTLSIVPGVASHDIVCGCVFFSCIVSLSIFGFLASFEMVCSCSIFFPPNKKQVPTLVVSVVCRSTAMQISGNRMIYAGNDGAQKTK